MNLETIIVSGHTFEHRVLLKRHGAIWNGADKIWKIIKANDETIAEISALPGVNITHTGDKITVDNPTPVAKREGRTTFYGNDRTYFNAFEDKDPITFAGFNSFADMLDFIDAIPSNIKSEYRRNSAWNNSDTTWKGTDNMAHAMKLARDGWAEGVAKAKEAMEIIEADHVLRRQRKLSVAGGRANVGRMLSSNPLHMVNRPRQHAKKVVTLFVEIVMSNSITAENAIIRAASVAAIADILETNGYSCEIIGVNSSRMYQVTVVLKSAGETLNLNDLIFAFGHPSMLRRFGFAIAAVNDAMARHWGSMGKTSSAFDNNVKPEPGSFYIDKIAMSDQFKVRGATFKDRVRSLFPLIVPEDFPVTLSE